MNERKHVNGFRPLRSNEKWHRPDFPFHLLKTGMRPVLLGENLTGVMWKTSSIDTGNWKGPNPVSNDFATTYLRYFVLVTMQPLPQ